MPDIPKRRWFRFSLRTMFVAFTVVAVWLGWNVYKVRERSDALASMGNKLRVGYIQPIPPTPGTTLTESGIAKIQAARAKIEAVKAARTLFGSGKAFLPANRSAVSALRQWLGDKPVAYVAYRPGIEPELMRRLFPEAIIIVPRTL